MKILFLLFSLALWSQSEPLYIESNGVFIISGDGLTVIHTASPLSSGFVSEEICGYAITKRRGLDFFRKNNARYEFDFSSSRLEALDKNQMKTRLATGYQEVKSRFTARGIFILLKIRWREFEFLFDTGYAGSFTMVYGDDIPFIKESHIAIESIDGTRSHIYGNKWLTLNDIYYASAIAVAKEKSPKVGMAFLKGFNWIIDFDKKKVFAKKNNIGLESALIKQNQVKSTNGNLVIVAKNVTAKNFELGDIITAVDHEKVTSSTICEIEKRLNGMSNWDNTELEIAGEK